MHHSSLYAIVCLSLLASTTLVSPSFAEDLEEGGASQLRRELSSSRRVGYLRQRTDSESDEVAFVMKDAYDKATYRIIAQPGLDLADFVDRHVSLHGETAGGTDGTPLRFAAERVIALDDQEPTRAQATKVRPAAFEPSDARPIERPRERSGIRVAALTDGLPAPSEVIETLPPLSIDIETAPESYVVEEPVTGFDWLRPPATRGIGLGGRAWIGAEYLLWHPTGMKLPPLVTGNPLGTPAAEAGVIGIPSTTILLGNGTILDDAQSGFRYSAGFWFRDRVALEVELFHFLEQNAAFHYDSSLNQILGRPFINLAPLVPPVRYDTQIIYFPPFTDGYINVSASSKFCGAAARLKFNLENGYECQNPCPGGCSIGCGPKPRCARLNLTAGYRYLRLEDYLRIEERVITAGDQFDAVDIFTTKSRFNGLEVGFESDFHYKIVDVNLFSRLAGGITSNQVQIAGQTVETVSGVVTSRDSGILTQASNIGIHEYDAASLVAELGIDFQRQVTPWLRVNAGYSVLYWGNVARAGKQIDLAIHPGLFEPQVAVPGTIGALPTHRYSDFFAHGFNVGATLVF